MSEEAIIRRIFGEKRYAYRTTFNGPLADVVLKDLARFCSAHKTTFDPNDRINTLAEGRRDVWLRIQAHLQLTDDELWDYYPRD